jgi:hypothetical protein
MKWLILVVQLYLSITCIDGVLYGPYDQPKFIVPMPRLPAMTPNSTRDDGTLFYHIPFRFVMFSLFCFTVSSSWHMVHTLTIDCMYREVQIDCGVFGDDGLPVMTTMWAFRNVYPGTSD